MVTKREIRWGLLENIADRETVAFAKHTDLTAFNYVGGEGEGPPEVMVIGQNPGAQEDIRKRPFVGASGIIQRMLMQRSGLRTKHVHVEKDATYPANCWLTNAIKFRTPGNRQPTEEEIELARPYLRQEWEAIGQPSIVVCVGAVARRAVYGNVGPRASGTWEEKENSYGVTMTLWFMTHPSVAVRDKGMATVLEGQWKQFERWFLG